MESGGGGVGGDRRSSGIGGSGLACSISFPSSTCFARDLLETSGSQQL